MSSYQDIINKKKKEWNCEELMEGARASRGSKIPFSSPLMLWSTYGGIPRAKISEFFGDAGSGKAQPLTSKVYTPTGYKYMRDIDLEDDVLDGKGNPCTVEGVYPQGILPCYRITLSDGSYYDVADNHLNCVNIKQDDGYVRSTVLNTDELIKLFKQGCPLYIESSSANFYSSVVSYSAENAGTALAVYNYLHFYGTYKFAGSPYDKDECEKIALDILENGYFQYIYSSMEYRQKLLNTFLSVSEELRTFLKFSNSITIYVAGISDLFHNLRQSLGYIESVDAVQSDIGTVFVHSRFSGNSRKIQDISYLGQMECKCIRVSSEEHTYLTDNFIVTHNTTTAVDLCKNAIDVFAEEHEVRLNELREKISQGNKGAKLEYENLTETGPKKVLYIDLEHTFDGEWAESLGIEESDIDVMQPPDVVAEDVLQTLQELIETGEIGLAVLDSIPSLVPRMELEKKLGERTVGALAGLMTVFCRKIVSILTRYDTTLLMINQTRDNMDNPYVVNTPGGRAPKFYSSLRIQFKLGAPIDMIGNELPNNTENPAGYLINARIVKQKSAPFDRRNASYFLLCNSGIRPEFDFAQLAVKKYGIIRKSGAWFSVLDPDTQEPVENEDGNPVKLNGMPKVYDYLNANPGYFNKLKEFIMNDIND